MRKAFNAVVAFVVREGKTPLGRALEHAVVASVALVASAAATQALNGDVRGAAVLVGTAVLAGLRQVAKEKF